MNRATDPLYPGRLIPDEQRSPFGLGWEWARRRWCLTKPLPFGNVEKRREFIHGYNAFQSSDPKVDEAMLSRGVPVEMP